MRKVFHVGSGMVKIPPEKGGAIELIIYEICNYGNKNGYDINFLNRQYNLSMNYPFSYIIKSPKLFTRIGIMISEFIFGLNSFFYLRKKKDIIIHCHNTLSALTFALFRKYSNFKLVYTCHNPAWSTPDNDLSLMNRFFQKIESYIMKKSDSVTTGSKASKKGIIEKSKINPEKINVIYNFVDTEKFSVKYGNEWKEKRKIKNMLLFVGKLIPAKGIEYLLKSVPNINEKEFKLVIVGPTDFENSSSPDRKWLNLAKELKIEENVIFTGAVSDEELPKIYSSADIFVFPTMKETFGVVLAEAMASGVVPVVTNLPVTKEVVADAGIYSEIKNPKDISDKVKYLFSNKEKMKEIKMKCLERAKIFRKEKILKNYINLYAKLDDYHESK